MTGWSVVRRSEAGRPASRTFSIEDSLGYLINRAARAMAQQLSNELQASGVGIGQWAILLFLWAGDGATQAELARVVAIEPPTVVRTVDRMVRDGMVERRADPSDGRVSRIYLTARGWSLRDELVPRAVAVNDRNMARMSPDESRVLMDVLRRIVNAR